MAKDANVSTTTSATSVMSENTVDNDSIPDSKLDASASWPLIGTKDQIPQWLRDNDYIFTGHPMPTHSYRRSLRLWRCLHMETMNIWTHLVGSAGFAFGIGLLVHGHNGIVMHRGDYFAFGSSLIAATVCFGLSAAFHTLRSHSYHVHHFWGRMDIFGICALAVGGGMSATYYAWYCHPIVWAVYSGLNACSAMAAAVTLFDTGGGGSKMRALRGGTFSLLAVSAMLPVIHRTSSLGWQAACEQFGAQYFLAEAVSLLVGVGLFVGRFPERVSPGSFDIWGHSHQLFHICAVVCTLFHSLALLVGCKYRHTMPSC